MKFQVRYSRLVSTHVILFPLFLGRKLLSRKIICRERERKKQRQTENIRLQIPPFLTSRNNIFSLQRFEKKKEIFSSFQFLTSLLNQSSLSLSLSLFLSGIILLSIDEEEIPFRNSPDSVIPRLISANSAIYIFVPYLLFLRVFQVWMDSPVISRGKLAVETFPRARKTPDDDQPRFYRKILSSLKIYIFFFSF